LPPAVAETPAADPGDALRHFERLLALETDCWDVHDSAKNGRPDFVLLDVRSPQLFQPGRFERWEFYAGSRPLLQ